MSVLLLPPIFQFFDDNGDPLAGGKVYTYAAGTTTPLATYTSNTGLIAASNPIQLDAAGRPESGSGAIWGEGAYKFIVKNASDVQVGDVLDNVTSFTTLAGAANPYFQTFSGNGTQTVFTTSDDLGTEEKGLLIWVDNGSPNIATNGTFGTDTDWTKGAGVTISAGTAVWSAASSGALSQTSSVTLVEGLAYSVTYTLPAASAGSLTPSIGGQAGIARTTAGTYREIIIAGSSQTIAFTGSGFTGTLDTVIISLANSKGYEILNPSAYTINGTSLTLATAPKTGVNNIYVAAPSLLLGAASSAAALAQVYATNALNSATSAAAYAARNKWTYSNNVNMADPSSGNIRFNNSTLNLATGAAISVNTADAGNPSVANWIATWDDTASSPRGEIVLFKDESNFIRYQVTGASTNNTTWYQLVVTNTVTAGTISNGDTLYIGFTAYGLTTVTGGITALTGNVTASGVGSVVATIANDAVTLAKLQNATANSILLGSGASGSGIDYSEITLGTNLSMSGTTLNAATSSTFLSLVDAQATFDGTGATGNKVLNTSKNITSVNKTASGVYAVTLASARADTYYHIYVMNSDTGGVTNSGSPIIFDKTTTTFNIYNRNQGNGVNYDSNRMSFYVIAM